MDKLVYVIGHRNPDTDSVVSAAAYARLKVLQGMHYCRAGRAGKINPQTEYIFNRFAVPVPEFIPDLVPKVAYYLNDSPVSVPADISLWEALERMERESLKVLPIVNQDGTYKSLLHYNAFAKYILQKINPHKKSAIPTSINLLINTLRAQPITVFDETEVRKSLIVVAGSTEETFRAHLSAEMPENALVIVGDRKEIQRFCIEKHVRALVITNGITLEKDIIELAEQNRVSIIISPFDTSSTSLLIIYSTPVGFMGDETIQPVNLRDPVRKIRQSLSQSASRCLPVVDDENHIAGVISEGDLIKESNLEVIMVDHNEPTQAIEGIENYKILEVIDHHRLGNLSTRYPITFINKVVGATSTIITNLYREQRVPLDRPTASILLCGILADTLVLQSATTTDIDREAAEYLASITGLEIPQLGRELMSAASQINNRPAEELVRMDMKEYQEQGAHFTVSQVETDTPEELVARKDEILAELNTVKHAGKRLFSALMVTDVTELTSILFVEGEKNFVAQLSFPKLEEGVYMLKDIVSRKKQLMPLLAELVENTQ
ncbi:putative manganese-dependent inorganic diphosphatase [Gracilinema caldarium]|jgi:manganese-dependent inorganic pyrophosphatase|uniref:inorganic diphosphatase n=1 Tax=Gracilinema caldarium (strain ATCC 51460 / DSM 7334 / H1) TaxID=744872 RepID=F8F4E9_GRAC1|nr:putative manganese-dependent inorganic diphosphatase [Gracilinema caldarium]AEJ20596.1 Inorganic diphosphatase [Gracilinema caldarium DSM 7334]